MFNVQYTSARAALGHAGFCSLDRFLEGCIAAPFSTLLLPASRRNGRRVYQVTIHELLGIKSDRVLRDSPTLLHDPGSANSLVLAAIPGVAKQVTDCRVDDASHWGGCRGTHTTVSSGLARGPAEVSFHRRRHSLPGRDTSDGGHMVGMHQFQVHPRRCANRPVSQLS